jgi:hypothetical protein
MVAATVSATSAAPIGKPPPSALRHRDQVRRQAERREREHLAGAAEAALISSAMSSAPVRWHAFSIALASAGGSAASAFALDRLDDDAAASSRHQLFERRRSSVANDTPASSGWNGSR